MILSRNRGQFCLKRSSFASSSKGNIDSLKRPGGLSRGMQSLSRKAQAAPEDAVYQTFGSSRESDNSLGNRVISTATDTTRQGAQLSRQLRNRPSEARQAKRATKGFTRTTGRSTKKAAKKARAAAQRAARSAKVAAQTAKAGTRAAASVAKAAAATVGSMGPVLIIVLICFLVVATLVGGVVSIISSLSLKSEDWELTKTYTYITELDVMVYEGILEAAEAHPGHKEYQYFVNGEKTTLADINIQTDTDAFLTYLDCKYQDYTLDGVLRIFGVKVRNEITKIHGDLYTVIYKEKKVTIPDPEPKPDPPPRRPGDPPIITPLSRGAQTKNPPSQDKNATILEVHLKAIPLGTFIEENDLLTEDEKETYDIILALGPHTTRQNLGDPFPDKPWAVNISSRFGWRIHPMTGEKDNHPGLDIAMPEGTPIAASISGRVTTVSRSDTGYGNVVVIESIDGKQTVLYAHCSSLAVRRGQDVSRGEMIASVGSTGQSTGPHLHIQYTSKNRGLNPAFYLRGCWIEGEGGD